MQRERSFAIRDGDIILNGTFDRLVVLYDGNRIMGADVLDYKTDDVPGDDPRAVDARVAQYRPQLEAIAARRPDCWGSSRPAFRRGCCSSLRGSSGRSEVAGYLGLDKPASVD